MHSLCELLMHVSKMMERLTVGSRWTNFITITALQVEEPVLGMSPNCVIGAFSAAWAFFFVVNGTKTHTSLRLSRASGDF